MKVSRVSGIAAIVVALTIGVTSCSSSAGEQGATTGTLEFVNDKAWDFESFSKVSDAAIGVTLNSTRYSDQEAFVAFVKQSLRTNVSPGLFSWHTGHELEQLVDQGLVAETTSIWSAAVDAGEVSDSVRDLYTVDGKQYCVPISVDDWVMFYNKKIFDKYGIEKPSTWDELMTAAATLKDNGVTPFWNQTKTWSFVWFQTILAATDLELFTELSTGEASYTDPRVVEVMDYWLEMQEKGYFNDPGELDFPEIPLKAERVAMVPTGTWWTGELTKVGMSMGTDYDAFTIPTIVESDTTPVAVETSPACVAEKSSQRDMGLKYSEWLMLPESQTAWAKQQQNLPYAPEAKAATPEMNALGTELNSGAYTFYQRYYEATPTPILTTALDQFSAFLTNRGDPLPYLEIIEDEAKSYWAEQ